MNEQQEKVFLDRYAMKDTLGKPIETSRMEMWDRVADGIGSTVEQIERFRDILYDSKFVPGGRILAGAGTETEVTFYNCYVIPIETRQRRLLNTHPKMTLVGNNPSDPGSDSREAILDSISAMVDIMSRGGGVGINWSVLRPKGAHLLRVNGTTSGPVSWMDVASHAVQTVTQGGSRRGAAMFMLDDWHPDVLEFINAKRDLTKITGANVSVAVSDRFMRAVEDDSDWSFHFPDTSHPAYNTEWDGDLTAWTDKGYGLKEYGHESARTIWKAISEAAWQNGEPGVVFLDRYNKESTGLGIERIICVNPCGEQGLGPYSVCNLGSMNLDAYITKTSHYEKVTGYEFDWDSFANDAEIALEFLDCVIDKNFYFIEENKRAQKSLRRVGLGVMGLADAMLALGIRYGSPESIEFTERVFRTLKDASIVSSLDLAKEKGHAPAWDLRETYKRPYIAEYLERHPNHRRDIEKYGLRNMFLLTQAPTGSTSILTGVNSGIEPYFAFEYTRVDRTGTHKVVASAIEKYRREGVVMGPEWVTSNDITVEEHIAVQAAVQKYVDSSVSKTVNGPNEHTIEDVELLFRLAYDSGLKGVAYFRDGNGRDQVLYKEEPKSAGLQDEYDSLQQAIASLVPDLTEYERPSVLDGTTRKVQTRAGTAYVTVNRDPSSNRPVEVFFNVGKAGTDLAAMAEALGRLGSLALRKGATLGGVANQLDGVGGNTQFNRAIPHGIAVALTQENLGSPVLPEGPQETAPASVEPPPQATRGQRFDICPECHNASLAHQEGCSKCGLCGFSAC